MCFIQGLSKTLFSPSHHPSGFLTIKFDQTFYQQNNLLLYNQEIVTNTTVKNDKYGF